MQNELPKSYYGGKNGSGVYQTIINQFPPHDLYIEGFLGNGAILKLKKPAKYTIAIDIDLDIMNKWAVHPLFETVDFRCYNTIEYLEIVKENMKPTTLIYLDPPYLLETRSTPKKQYKHELTREDHIRLLQAACNLNCMVAISCYDNELYSSMLEGWRKIQFKAQTRRGTATETLYMNYPQPTELHDYSFIGSNYRERYRIAKKVDRHIKLLERLPALERNAIIEGIRSNF